MAPPPWADPLELTWLHNRMADFIKRQAEGKLHLFKPAMEEDWFREFPEQRKLGLPLPKGPDARQLTQDELATLGAAIQARKGQLDNWFRNQRKKIGNANGPATRVGANVFERFLKLSATKRQLDQSWLRPLTETNKGDDEDDWTDETEDSAAARLKRTKSDRMRMRTRVVQGLWAEASDEEREAVGAEVLEEKRKLHEEELQREKSSAELKSTSPWELQE
ncbi:hypothetical protein B0H10DRAFT_1969228 [Mycena sp. CBHHK59/15]|nr:hypothetical protein B0H10DRAFT_1969228 [Mycena sp. CBHHK59/15]